MDISGLVQPYDSRAVSSAALTRTIMAPQYGPAQTFSSAAAHSMVATHQQLQHHNPFSFSSYSGANNVIIPAFANNFIQQRPLPRLMQADDDGHRAVSYTRISRPGYIEDHRSQSPTIKSEPMWATPVSAPALNANPIEMPSTSAQPEEINFGTEVDTLMKAIQAKSQTTQPQATSSAEQTRPVVGAFHTPPSRDTASHTGGYAPREEAKSKLLQSDLQGESGSHRSNRKRYQCTIANCHKSFYQKTHLDIHERAHTGVKPYPCKEPGCGRSFSQLGNLRTHERRHTGERPYQCDICGKRFAQRGNVRAHKIVHDQSKPYLCRLDDCGKQFTQLGNLKSHQNKFHVETIRKLTAKYTSTQDGDIFNAAEKELWEYFANLYKNSNKGIKGRGKDRKVGSNSMSLSSSMRSLGVGDGGRGFGVPGSGRGNMVVGVNGTGRGGANGGYEQKYEIFDVEEDRQSGHSQSHSGSIGPSSVGTCYENAPPDGFGDAGRGNHELAFGDRIY